jgi:hypothetical protein
VASTSGSVLEPRRMVEATPPAPSNGAPAKRAARDVWKCPVRIAASRGHGNDVEQTLQTRRGAV